MVHFRTHTKYDLTASCSFELYEKHPMRTALTASGINNTREFMAFSFQKLILNFHQKCTRIDNLVNEKHFSSTFFGKTGYENRNR